VVTVRIRQTAHVGAVRAVKPCRKKFRYVPLGSPNVRFCTDFEGKSNSGL